MPGLTIPFTGLKRQYNTLRTEILNATDEVLRSGQLMNGNNTTEFEHWLAKKNRVRYAVTCHSGTQALEILASWERLQHDTTPTVLVPSLTFPATVNAFLRNDWNVEFVDVDNLGIFAASKIPQLTAFHAIVVVGLYGAAIDELTDSKTWQEWSRNKVRVFEDAAQHWLASGCQRIGEAAAISFDPMKNLPCYGNGGAVLTNNWELFSYALNWRDNGKHGQHTMPGSNSRMSEIDCAHLLIKSQHIDQWQDRRRTIAKFWIDRLKDTGIRVVANPSQVKNSHAFHKFVIDVDNRNQLREQLAIRKIETKIHYEYPLHELYNKLPGPGLLATASSLARRVLSLPIYPELTDLEVEYIIDQVIDSVKKGG